MTGKLPLITADKLISLLEKNGFSLVRQSGSHKIYRNSENIRHILTDADLRYPRDSSLDPQLVWKWKDEQNGSDLEVPVVPIYIQNIVHPKVIIEEFLESQI